MMNKTEEQFLSDIASKKFDAVYILAGTDSFKKNEIIGMIKKSSENSFDVSVHYSNELDPNLFLNDVSAQALFSNKKTVILKNFESLKKEPKKTVASYFKNPNRSTLLVVTYDEELKASELEKEFGEFEITCVKIYSPDPREIEEYVKKEFEKNSKEIDEASLLYLCDCIDSYGMLVNETEKLLTYLKHKKKIEIDETVSLVNPFKETDRFEIIKAVISNDRNRLYSITEELISSYENPLAIINSFTLALEKILKITALKKSHINDYSLAFSIGIFRSELSSSFRFINETKLLKVIDYCLGVEKTLKSSTTHQPYVLVRNAAYVISDYLMTS